MLDLEKTNLSVYKTKNYDQFDVYPSNRDVTTNKNLEEEILERNKLKFHPIVVSTDAFIIDGQHRRDICKRNDLDMYLVIDNEAQEDDIRLSQSAKTWRQKDFLHYYTVRDYPTYQIIDRMMNSHRLSISCFIRHFCEKPEAYSSISTAFNKGKILLKYDEKFIDNKLTEYDSIRSAVNVFIDDSKIKRNFENAMIMMLLTTGFNVNQMVEKIEKFPSYLKKAYALDNIEHITVELTKLYNRYGKSDERKIHKVG